MNSFYLDGRLLKFNPGLLPAINIPTIPQGQTWHIIKRWGRGVTQQFTGNGYGIALNYFRLNKSLEFAVVPETDGFTSTIAVKNLIVQTICGNGKIRLEEGQFASAFGRVMERRIRLKKQTEHIFLDLNWTRELVSGLLPPNHAYSKLLAETNRKMAVMVGEPYRQITPALQELMLALHAIPYQSDIQIDSIDSLMIEILGHILSISSSESFLSEQMSEIELQKIYRVRAFILSNLNIHFTSNDLAKMSGLGRTVLIRRFRQVTGKSLQEFLLFHRCRNISGELMNTDIPYKVLAQKSGYSDVPNFINGFKKHMGCSPTVLRRRFNQ